jgi:Alpha-L-arabinofuranosidase B (ABFB) domain
MEAVVNTFWFQSFNLDDHYIRHRDFLGELAREVVGQEADYAFTLLNRGHGANGEQLVALRSVNFADRYLRHRGFRIRLEGRAGSDDALIWPDSTFVLEPGLAAPANPNAVSFRSHNYGDRYLRHRDFHLWLDPKTSPNLAPDATFLKVVSFDIPPNP